MSSQRNKKINHEHKWIRIERKLEDGFIYHYYTCETCHQVKYPSEELSKIFLYKKEHLFLTLRETVMILLYAGEKIYSDPNKNYIPGITFLQKLLFLFYMEVSPNLKIPAENPGYFSYKYGPYSDSIDDLLNVMIETKSICTSGGRKSSSTELFYLSDAGKIKAKNIFEKLNPNQQQYIIEFRKFWDQKKLVGIMKYVYSKYPDYTNKSIVLNDLFPGVKLNRRRG
jgi:hypothetical protein